MISFRYITQLLDEVINISLIIDLTLILSEL